MQAGTVSRLRFCGRSWGLKIHFWWNMVRFWKPYVCSNQVDVYETNFSFAQFNRIRNYLFGCRIEVRRYARSWLLASDRCTSWKHESEPKRTGRLHKRKQSQKVINDLDNVDFIPSNVQSSHQEALSLKTTKQWSRWSQREGVLPWDMSPEPTELLLIGYSIELIWTTKSKSNTLTPKTNSQTCQPRGGEFHTWRMESSFVF